MHRETDEPGVGQALQTSPNPAVRPGPIPSLDGIRAIAVLIVLVSHAGFGDIVPGGLGVTVFFFLSGYLITTLLVDEQRASNTVGVRNFYLRRALRLYPSLLVTLVLAYSLLALDVIGGGFSWGGLLSQLFYFANYQAVFFDSGASTPEGTGILWSLAVEEHFYIVFPLLMLLVLRTRLRMQRLAIVFAALCVLALAWRLYLTSLDGFDPLRTYYSTDTRFDSIVFGCLLAVTLNPARLPDHLRRPAMRRSDWVVFGAGITLLIASIVPRDELFRESWRYSLQGLALLPIFFYAVRFPAVRPFNLLGNRFLARVGVLSYAIYLVHFVFIAMLQTIFGVDVAAPILVVMTITVSVAYAEALDRLVEPWFRRRRATLR